MANSFLPNFSSILKLNKLDIDCICTRTKWLFYTPWHTQKINLNCLNAWFNRHSPWTPYQLAFSFLPVWSRRLHHACQCINETTRAVQFLSHYLTGQLASQHKLTNILAHTWMQVLAGHLISKCLGGAYCTNALHRFIMQKRVCAWGKDWCAWWQRRRGREGRVPWSQDLHCSQKCHIAKGQVDDKCKQLCVSMDHAVFPT